MFYTCTLSDKDWSRNFVFPPNNNRIIVRGGENNLIMAVANLTIDQA